MTAQRPESAPDATYFCGVAYPTAEAAVAARNGMRHAPKGLRVKHCEVCQQYHLRARNNLHGRYCGRGLGLPAGLRVARHDRAYVQASGLAGKAGTPSLARWVAGDGVPVDVREERQRGEV
jgi:hypothetical protein